MDKQDQIKEYEDRKNKWTLRASKFLVGKKIAHVRYMKDEELEEMGWYKSNLVIFFDDNSYMFASADDEGNESGVLFTSDEDFNVIPSIVNYGRDY